MITRTRVVVSLVVLLLLIAVSGVIIAVNRPDPIVATGGCAVPTGTPPPSAAGDILDGRLRLGSHRVVSVPRDPTWAEDPLADANWLFQYHSLRWLEPLWAAWKKTNERRYLDRYAFLLRDWHEDNPFMRPASSFSWDDHAAAFRGMIYACALRRIKPAPEWLLDAANRHGDALRSDSFYVGYGNHALNQSIGLLELGCALAHGGWKELATSRIEALVLSSVDDQGVTNEQAEAYQIYNYNQYGLAIERLEACKLPSVTLSERRRRMPQFMAWAALPSARLTMIGDTADGPLPAIDDPAVEFVRSGGASGTRPDGTSTVWQAGYAFFRSGWGETRPLAEETAVSVRFGPGRAFHGHLDAAAVTLAAYGDRLLLDPGGPYKYEADKWRAYFVSERAHNTVSVDGVPMRGEGSTDLIGRRHTAALDFLALTHSKIPGTIHTRRIVYSRALDALMVEDDLESDAPRTHRQWWHLHPEMQLRVDGAELVTERAGPNVLLRQLVDDYSTQTFRGDRDPVQGWITPRYGALVPAPAVSFAKRGERVRYVTLVVPFEADRIGAEVSDFSLRPDGGFDLTLVVRGRRARISVSEDTASEALDPDASR